MRLAARLKSVLYSMSEAIRITFPRCALLRYPLLPFVVGEKRTHDHQQNDDYQEQFHWVSLALYRCPRLPRGAENDPE